MPTLHWVGKNKVENHHHEVPFRLLDKQYSFTGNEGAPANSTNNKIIHGDNLEALKSLLPEFEGKVDCIYIDPPYNTGNEGWVYNDNVNDPKIKKWLGQVVGKEGEDLSRHDKWLCMMYPRLKLLHRLLADDGVIFVSIDDNEQAHLKLVMDDIFGISRFIAQIPWRKRTAKSDVPFGISQDFESILCYSKGGDFSAGIQGKERRYYETPDLPNRPWRTHDLTKQTTAEERPNSFFTMVNPKTGKEYPANPLRTWAVSKETFQEYYDVKKIVFPGDYDFLNISNPVMRYFKDDDIAKAESLGKTFGNVAVSTMLPDKVGMTQHGTKEITDIFETKIFNFPKPSSLIQFLLEISTDEDSLILDSFAGSGTTAHAVLKLNAQDGGKRRFILCEMMDYAETITAERVRRVINGYGEGAKAVAGTGGGFDFYTVGAALFKEDKNLNEEVGEAAIRDYVAYTESIPAAKRFGYDNPISRYALGASDTVLHVFYYEKDRVTTLDIDFLGQLNIKNLPSRPEQFVIYADKCALDKDFLYKHGITFKRIPRDITQF